MADVKRSDLVNAAKTLNDLLGLEPEIDVKAKPPELTEKLKTAAGMLEPEDALPDDVKETLIAIEAIEGEEPEKTEPEQEEKPKEEKTETPEDLVGLIEGTAKLAALKKIVNDFADQFGNLCDKLDEYKGLAGPKALKADMLTALGADGSSDKKDKEPKPKKDAKGEGTRSASKGKKPGIINTIVETIEKSGKKGVTKDEILNALKETFPDRDEKSMKNTINVQVPNRITKEKFKVVKTEDGRYFKEGK